MEKPQIAVQNAGVVERIPVTMIREDLENLPSYPLPAGYQIRAFRPGEEEVWAAIETAAGEFWSVEQARAHFAREFGAHLDEMQSRCLFLETTAGGPIGTTTAWYHASFRGKDHGRIHWVGIHPDYQGRGLAKPLVGAALARLAQAHRRAYLTTQTTSWIAIKVYLDCGFTPLPGTPRFEDAWELIARLTRHPALAKFQSG